MSPAPRRRSTRSICRGVAGASLALTLLLGPGAIPGVFVPPASAAVTADGQTQFSVPEYRAAGNATVEELYRNADPSVPRPVNMDIWPSDSINQSLNFQTQPDQRTCSVTMMGQSESRPMNDKGIYPDVTREFAQTTPAVARAVYDQRPHFDNGYMLTRPATAEDTNLTESGRVQVTSADAGNLTLGMDGWTNTSGITAPGNVMQYSRLRLATEEPVQNFRLVLRMDDAANVNTSITTMANWNGWWAPGYTQAPTGNFTITYETGTDGIVYAVITADEVPAQTWATVTFRGEVAADDWAEGGQLYSWSAATANFSTLQCEPPLPAWEKQTVRPGESVAVANTGDAIPQGTLPAATTFTAAAPEGWGEIAIDATTGQLTATVPEGQAAGDYTFPVTITYGDGTTETVEVTIAVLPMPTYEDTTVNQGEQVTVPAPLDQTGQPIPEGSEFAPGTDVPEWVTINEDGTLTVAPGPDVAPGNYDVPIVVTYPDGSTGEVTAQVTVVNPNDPVYEDGTVQQGESVTIPAPTNPGGTQLPEGSTFAPGVDVPGWVTVNEDGTLTVTPGVEVPAGQYTVPVVVTYPDGSTETIDSSITVVNPNAPSYEGGTVEQGGTITVPAPTNPDGTPMPDGTGFAPSEDTPSWVTVNEDGTLTVAPGYDIPAGEYVVPVTVSFPDGSSGTVEVAIEVVSDNSAVYQNGTVQQGSTITVPAPANEDGSPLPEGSAYATGEGAPSWVTVSEDGTLTVAPGYDIPAGEYVVPVTISFPDGSMGEVTSTITVVSINDPVYESGTVDQGETITIPAPTNPGDSPLPEGSTFAPGEGVPGWVTVNEDGTVTVAPGTDVAPGGHTFEVVVTYPDGTSETVDVTVVVVNPNAPVSEGGTVEQGESVTIPTATNPDGTPLPEGSTFAPGEDVPGWVTVNEDGSVTASPGSDVTPGGHTFEVVVTYPDGTSEVIDVTVVVVNPNAPVSEGGTVDQGETITVPAPANPDGSPLPEGSTFAPGEGVPGWVTVNEDGSVTVSPGSDVTPGGHTFEVVVTYPDGTSEVIDVTVVVVNPNTPVSEGGTVEQGETLTVPAPANPDGSPLPEGSTFAPGEGVPGWVTVNEDGTVTVAPGTDVTPGDHTIEVVVTYPDGTTETVDVIVTVTPAEQEPAPGDDDEPGEDPGDTPPGDKPGDKPAAPAPGPGAPDQGGKNPGAQDKGDQSKDKPYRGPLARTGMDVALPLAAALLLMGAGAGLILRVRRRS